MKATNTTNIDEFSRSTFRISDVCLLPGYFFSDLHEDGGFPTLMAELIPLSLSHARRADAGNKMRLEFRSNPSNRVGKEFGKIRSLSEEEG